MKNVKLCVYLFLLLLFIITQKGFSHGMIMRDENSEINITTTESLDVTFSCDVMESSYRKLIWVKKLRYTRDIIAIATEAKMDRVSVWKDDDSRDDFTRYYLKIDPVKKDDEGKYYCKMETLYVSTQSQKNFTLTVNVRPSVTGKSHVDVVEGNEATLRCKADGKPQPEVMWGREDGEMINVLKEVNQTFTKVQEMHYFGEELRLGNTTRNDAGTYLCLAGNMVPPVATFKVHLRVLRVFIDDSASPKHISYHTGQHKTLKCLVYNIGLYTVSWIRVDNGTTLTTNNDMLTTDIRISLNRPDKISWNLDIYLLKPEDAGKYICQINTTPAKYKEYSLKMY